jgi:pyridoxine kinase
VTLLKKIAVINDISGFGKCSLTVSLPIISALGVECNPIPTAILSNQTGYDDFYSVDFTENMSPYIDVWKKQNAHFDAILTGYLASEKQVDIILDFIENFKYKNTLVFVDPVMADDGVLYNTYDEKLCEKVKTLTKKANIITPNLTELCVLCDANYEEVNRRNDLSEISSIASSLLSETTNIVIVTGVKSQDNIYNILVKKDGVSVVKSPLLNGSYSGTGDIFSSVVCGLIVSGKSVYESVNIATQFIVKSIVDTPTKLNYEPNGVNFQKHLEMLINAK